MSKTNRITNKVTDVCENTDKEIWRKKEGDYYSPSIHVTKNGGIGIHVKGSVVVMPVENWHTLGELHKLKKASPKNKVDKEIHEMMEQFMETLKALPPSLGRSLAIKKFQEGYIHFQFI